MTARIRLLIPALRELGPGALYQYGVYAFALRSGMLRRRSKSYRWSDRPLESWLISDFTLQRAFEQRQPFFFEANKEFQDELRHFSSEELLTETEEILAGRFRIFGGPPVSLGVPPDWGKVPLGQGAIDLDQHWTEIDTETDLDLRLLWEPSRFGWAFTLGRAYQATGEQRYVEGALDLLSSWLENNQPNRGPHWISAQEVALRIMALTFMWHTLPFEDYPTQAAQLLAAVAAHAQRIPPTLSYARAQRNNHLLSEAVGLYTAGLLMPWFERSAEWKRLGRRWLVSALEDQIFDDGGYIQYSTNYQRLALGAGLWAAQLAKIHGEPLHQTTQTALRRMTQFLLTLTDPDTGHVPNWGHNDGSNILPLSTSEQGDYRPLLQAAARAFIGSDAYGSGPWDEMCLWLGLKTHKDADPIQIQAEEFPTTGLYLMQGETSRAILRCVRFKARPAHSDQLNLDLWWNEHNIARDAGTYLYTGSANSTAAAAAHNGLVLDGIEPMDRAGRFLWLNWSNARYLGRWQADDGSVQAMASEHRMRSGVTHRRSVVHAGGSLWVVLDELLGAGNGNRRYRARVAWNLIDWPWELDAQRLTLRGDHGPLHLRLTPGMDKFTLYREGEVVAGEPQETEDPSVLGWWSPTYGYREPSLTLVATVTGRLPLRMTSWWRLGDVEPQDLSLEWDSLQEDPLMAFLSNGQ